MIQLKLIRVLCIFGCFIIFACPNSFAQSKSHIYFQQKGGKLYSFGFEYVLGFNNSIEPYSLNLGYGAQLSKNLALHGLLDVSATSGTHLLNTNTALTTFNAESFGVGTSFLLRWYFIKIGGVRLFINAGGGILYTFKNFPPNGTRLNFTARPDAGLTLHLNSFTQFSVSVNRFHLSNGQGYKHPHKTSFHGLGIFANIGFQGK